MRQLDRILSAYGVDATDKPAFRALVELGIRPDASLRRKLRGPYKACLDEISDGVDLSRSPISSRPSNWDGMIQHLTTVESTVSYM